MPLLTLLILAMVQLSPLPDANPITIIDGGKFKPYSKTQFDAGPAAGDGLNGHFFPSVIAYNTGNYNYAFKDFDYVVRNDYFLDGNPRKSEFMSITHYLRGMIYLYHARGIGRHQLAKAEFQAALKWNPANYQGYLELSRVYSDLGFVPEATKLVQQLLELKPPQDIVEEAQTELKKLSEIKPD